MKKIFILSVLIFCFQLSFTQDFPEKPNKPVNDFTGILTWQQVKKLENKLFEFDDSTSNQIAVVIIKSVSDYDINEYALELGRRWGVGNKNKNNGVVMLIAIGDRKLSIQTGYGLEGALPDIYVKRIIESDIKPYFKTGQYYQGIDAGINSIIKLIKGEYKGQPKAKKKEKGGSVIAIIVIILIIIIIINRSGNGGNQIISGRGAENALFWPLLLGRGRSNGGNSGWGGGSSGGFGGFGGGSFGGGGSSGSW